MCGCDWMCRLTGASVSIDYYVDKIKKIVI